MRVGRRVGALPVCEDLLPQASDDFGADAGGDGSRRRPEGLRLRFQLRMLSLLLTPPVEPFQKLLIERRNIVFARLGRARLFRIGGTARRLLSGQYFIFRRYPQDSGSNQLAEFLQHGSCLHTGKKIGWLGFRTICRIVIRGQPSAPSLRSGIPRRDAELAMKIQSFQRTFIAGFLKAKSARYGDKQYRYRLIGILERVSTG